MAKTEDEKDIIVRMVRHYREWYAEWVGAPVQYSSKNAYVIEYNTMKGIFNMLMGSYRARNPKLIPGDDIILGMWRRMLSYIREKKMYYYLRLYTISKGYNVIVPMMMRHAEKEREGQTRSSATTRTAPTKEDKATQTKLDIVQKMLGVNE